MKNNAITANSIINNDGIAAILAAQHLHIQKLKLIKY